MSGLSTYVLARLPESRLPVLTGDASGGASSPLPPARERGDNVFRRANLPARSPDVERMRSPTRRRIASVRRSRW